MKSSIRWAWSSSSVFSSTGAGLPFERRSKMVVICGSSTGRCELFYTRCSLEKSLVVGLWEPEGRLPLVRPSPVTAEEQAAFKAEMPVLRAAIKKIRRTGWRHPGAQTIARLTSEAAACRARLDFWENVLVVEGNKIRSPVRLWDVLHKLAMMAEINELELEELQHEFA